MPFLLWATTYYVSPKGSNANPGTKEKPWATPGYATKRMAGGDTLVILEGEYTLSRYWDDMLTPPSGSPGKWTVIKGEGKVVLRGKGNLLAAVDLGGKKYIRIENLEITNYNGEPFREGITAWGPCSHIELKNLHIHHIDEMCIDLRDPSHLKILNSKIHHCGFGAIGGPAPAQGGWRDVLIQECYLAYSGHYYQGGPGPSPYDRPDGFGIEPSEGPVEIVDCLVEHNRGDGIDSKAKKTYIHRTIVANNSCDGVKVWGGGSRVENVLIYGRGDGDPTPTPWASLVIDQVREAGARFEIVNVTVYDRDVAGNYPVYVGYDQAVSINVLFRNLIIFGGSDPVYIGPKVNFSMDHCDIYIPGSAVQIIVGGRRFGPGELSRLGQGNMSRDPLFVLPTWGRKGDFHLKKQSPCIDSGTSRGAPSDDLDGGSRPWGRGVDMGAYEYGASSGKGKLPPFFQKRRKIH